MINGLLHVQGLKGVSLRYLCNLFSVVGVVFDGEETDADGSYDISFSWF